MKKIFSLSLLILMLTISCSKSDDPTPIDPPQNNNGQQNPPAENPDSSEGEMPQEEEVNPIDSYVIFYMLYNRALSSGDLGRLARLEYDSENRITRRVGGIYDANVDPLVGFTYRFSDQVYDEITYEGNTMIVETKTLDPALDIEYFKRTFTLNADNKPIQKIIERGEATVPDTLDFEYDDQGRLSRITSRDRENIMEQLLYYDGGFNLDSIITHKEIPSEETTLDITEIFGGDDRSENPLQGLFMFEETFTRSLSWNNYTTYFICTFKVSPGGGRTTCWDRRWNLKYDEEGNVIFNEL